MTKKEKILTGIVIVTILVLVILVITIVSKNNKIKQLEADKIAMAKAYIALQSNPQAAKDKKTANTVNAILDIGKKVVDIIL